MYQIMTERSVMVNEGSGVIVNAMSNSYSYVLTAKHVLEANNSLKSHIGNPINVIDVHTHPDCDCAVIQIDSLPDSEQSTWPADTLDHNAELMVAGFPKIRRNSPDKIKLQDGKITSFLDQNIILTAEGSPPQDLITGMSGGGVYYLNDGKAYLIGIEYSIDGEEEDEKYGRLKCVGLPKFEEVLSLNKLAPMIPCFLGCFSSLRESIFGFNVIDPNNVKLLQENLIKVADLLVEKNLPAPYQLLRKYRNSLLLPTEHATAVHDKELWVAYLEFIVICALIDNIDTVDDKYLQNLESKRIVLYSRANTNWLRNLMDILTVAKKTLDKGGTVFFTSAQENAKAEPPAQYLEQIIDNIAEVPSSGSFFEIDNVAEETYKTFKITHLKGLRDSCVVEKEWDYGNEDRKKLLSRFRNNYSEIIK